MVGVLRLEAREPRGESTMPLFPRSSQRKDQRILAPNPWLLDSARLQDGRQQIRFSRNSGQMRRAQTLVVIDGVVAVVTTRQSKKIDGLLACFGIHNRRPE